MINKIATVDLFAGCGGLSLGFESAGFETVFVNELHPVAMQTFIGNRPSSYLADKKNNVNDILEITRDKANLEALSSRLRLEHGDIGVVMGGPPCQGFSGIGHRRSFDVSKEEIPSNHLYREMANFVSSVAPRSFLFENVKGLLTAKWTPAGEKGEIWQDVLKTFSEIRATNGGKSWGYSIQWKLLHAKNFGVPQNRPRVILVGIRDDIAAKLSAVDFLPPPNSIGPDIEDLWSDLVDPNWEPGGRTESYLSRPKSRIQTSLRTRRDGSLMEIGSELTEQEYSNHRPEIIAKFEHMLANEGKIPTEMQTKKFAQRLLPAHWGESGPSITATSLADDFVHYAQPRVPTVREWARLQTFPDWYQFAGRRTTGGRRRAGDPSLGIWTRDLPKYTQIGNAVPVELGKAIAENLRLLIS